MRIRSLSASAADAVLASVLVVAALVELWLVGRATPLFVAVAIASTAPLALRRRYPLAVVVIVMGAGVALTVAGTDFFTTAELLAMLIAMYSVAAYEDRSRALVGLVVANVGGVTNSAAVAAPELGDVVFPVVLLSGPWAAGRALRLWRARTAQLQLLTMELAREREDRAALAVSAERARIARELHDVLTQSINVIVIHAEAADEALDRDPAAARRPLVKIQDTGRAALRETRRMLGLLREDGLALTPLPGAGDVGALVDSIRDSGLVVRLCVEGTPRPLPAALDLSAYRIVQQALTNTLAHARAHSAEVSLRYRDSHLEVEVVDDGRGHGDRANAGHGLVGMRERAALFGGELTAGPRPTGGYAVHARLPIDGPST